MSLPAGYNDDSIRDMSIDRKLGLVAEFDARETQFVVMLENLESFLIRETSNRILRDVTLIKAEKVCRLYLFDFRDSPNKASSPS